MTDLARALEEAKQAMREYFRQVTQRGPTPLLAQAHLKIAAKKWGELDFKERSAKGQSNAEAGEASSPEGGSRP